MALSSTNQGAREVYGKTEIRTPAGDSAMDDTNDAVRVNIVAGSTGASTTDGATYTPASTAGTAVMAAVDEVAPTAGSEGTVAIVRATTARGLHVNLRDSSGVEITSLGGGTEYAEDTATTAGDKLTMAGVVRKDTAATLVDTDGDRTQLQVDATGRLYVNASLVAVPVTDNSGSLTIDNAALSVVGGGVEATAVRVTVASDSTGVLSVDDNGGSLTVDGTVAVSSLPSNASVNVAQLAGTTTDTNSGNKSAGTLRVTLATDQVQLTNALKVDGSAVTQPVSGTVSTKTALTASAPGTVTISTSSAAVVAAAATRKGLILQNASTSGQRVSLAFANGTAVLDSGLTLYPGDVYVMDEFTFTTGAVNGIGSAATTVIGFQEYLT